MRCTCLTLVGLIACRDQPPPPPPPVAPHDGVVLVQPGAAPRQLLRYHPSKGARLTSELVYDADVKTGELGGPTPTQIVDLEIAVDDVFGDGAARLRITVVDARVRDRPGSQVSSDIMRAQAAAMRGVVITETLAPDGNISDARVEPGAAPDNLHRELDSVLQSLARVAARLPSEPVGAGAMWRERRTLPEGGVRAVSETTYTLTALTGTTVAYTTTAQSTGGPQIIEQDGARVEVTDTRGQATATGSVDLASYALDVTATSTFTTTMAVVASDAGADAGRSTIEIATAIRMTSAGATVAGAPGAGATPPPAPPDAGSSAEGAAAADHGAHSAP